MNSQRKMESSSNETKTNTNLGKQNTTYSSNKSGVTGAVVQEKNLDEVQAILDEYFEYCNNYDYENAYNMLTDRCKELIYPTLDAFKAIYIDNIFIEEKKSYSFENWYDNIYYVKIKTDTLSQGKIVGDEKGYNDYITIVNGKLNINSYINTTDINKEKDSENILVNVISKDTFMDYEIYNMTIKNNTKKTICLTDTQDSNDIYITDTKGVKYGVYNHELLKYDMILEPGCSRNLSFKFYSSYVSTKEIETLIFNKLIIDYENNQGEVSNEYKINF